tara:strand:- start:213 stop:458 length:246 start_codon:yes stop_codon:yes gene_type:complete
LSNGSLLSFSSGELSHLVSPIKINKKKLIDVDFKRIENNWFRTFLLGMMKFIATQVYIYFKSLQKLDDRNYRKQKTNDILL